MRTASLFVAFLAASSLARTGSEEAAIRKELQRRYDTAAAAFRRRDVPALMAVTSGRSFRYI